MLAVLQTLVFLPITICTDLFIKMKLASVVLLAAWLTLAVPDACLHLFLLFF